MMLDFQDFLNEVQESFQQLEIPENFFYINHEKSDSIFEPMFIFARQGYAALLETFDELCWTYAYSITAERRAKETRNESDALFFRTKIRNLHIRTFISRFDWLREYCAFFLNELSGPDYLIDSQSKEGVRQVSRTNFITSIDSFLKSDQKKAGLLSRKEVEKIPEEFETFVRNLNSRDRDMLKNYRDIINHRYLPGIDYYTISTFSDGEIKKYRKKEIPMISVGEKIHFYGNPDFYFLEIEPVCRQLIRNSIESLRIFSDFKVINQYLFKE